MSLINDALRRASKTHKDQTGQPSPAMPMHPAESAPKSNVLPYVVIPLFALSILGLVALGVWHFFGSKNKTKTAVVQNARAGATNARPVASRPASTPVATAQRQGTAPTATTKPAPATSKTQSAAPRTAVGPASTSNRPVARPTTPPPTQTRPATAQRPAVAQRPATVNTPTTPASRPSPTTNVGTAVRRPPVPTAVAAPPVVAAQPVAPTPATAAAAAAPAATTQTPTPTPTPTPDAVPTPAPWPEVRLQGVIMSATEPKAFINGEEFKVGEATEEGVTIRSIQRNKVVVEFSGQTKTLVIK